MGCTVSNAPFYDHFRMERAPSDPICGKVVLVSE